MKILKTYLGSALLAAALGLTPAAAQQNEDPVRIGVPMPLTGPLAQAGQTILAGIEYAAKEANESGGLLGQQIELLIEDTKSEPNTAAITGAKMATQDNVFAFVGGYGSTSDIALLQSVKRYEPIFVHAASSSVRIEEGFGQEDWYHHVYIWDYHRQKAATAFMESIDPKPKTVAIAYEDGLYGSDAAKYSEQYMPQAGFEIVMREPFRAGSPDLSPILNRVKSIDPDVFFFVGYSGDNIQVARQMRNLDVDPKLLLIVAAGEKRSDFAEAGVNVAVIGEWAREQRTEGIEKFVDGFLAAQPSGSDVLAAHAQGYTAMRSLIEAVSAAGSLDRDAVLEKLGSITFQTPYGPLSYKQSDGGAKHQLLTNENMVVWQYRETGQEVVWPAEKAGGELVYPAGR